MKKNIKLFFIVLPVFCFIVPGNLFSQEELDVSDSTSIRLENAAMCEAIESFKPKNSGVVFSVNIGKVLCFTFFNNVQQETVVFHNWFRRDQLITKRKLTLKPPEWSSFSGIELREADVGPWHVNITNENGTTLKTLRFSITE